MTKFSFEKIVKADRKKVFDVVANYEEFQNTLPQYFPSVRTHAGTELTRVSST